METEDPFAKEWTIFQQDDPANTNIRHPTGDFIGVHRLLIGTEGPDRYGVSWVDVQGKLWYIGKLSLGNNSDLRSTLESFPSAVTITFQGDGTLKGDVSRIEVHLGDSDGPVGTFTAEADGQGEEDKVREEKITVG